MDDLSALEAWSSAFLSKLQPAERRRVMMDIARELRRRQQARILSQRNPDGSAYEPRKPRKDLRGKQGRIKRGAMFKKLRTAAKMQIEAKDTGIAIGYAGRVAKIARIHQFGETSQVVPGGSEYKYPSRRILGLTQEDREMIRDKLLDHLSH